MYKVLIVDDKSLIRKGIISSINWEESGVKLAGEAENGRLALAMIKNEEPDILITDIRMPDMDGLELLKSISGLERQIVKIVISGYDDFEYAQKAIKYGSIDYIMKPIDPAELNESLKKACSILDHTKLPAQTSEQLIRDIFQKAIKGIDFNLHEYKTLFDKFGFDRCLYCVSILKNGRELLNDVPLHLSGIMLCTIEESKDINALVWFANSESMVKEAFESAVYRLIRGILTGSGAEDVFSGIGSVEYGLEQLSNSYKMAYEAALHGIFTGSGKIVGFQMLGNKKPLEIKLQEYESELVIHLTSGNSKEVVKVIDRLFERVAGCSDISFESIKLLFRNLCYILLKLNADINNEINDFLEKLSLPGYLLKYSSISDLIQIIHNFYFFTAQKYLDDAGGRNSAVSKVRDYIDRNYSRDIGLNELSSVFHINASYLTRIFKQEEGDGINAYITKVRIENAKRILESGRVNIEKLAEAVGYEDSTYFFKVFKKITGMTPREYLLKNKNK